MREKVKYLQSSQQLLPKKEKKKKREYGKKKNKVYLSIGKIVGKTLHDNQNI